VAGEGLGRSGSAAGTSRSQPRLGGAYSSWWRERAASTVSVDVSSTSFQMPRSEHCASPPPGASHGRAACGALPAWFLSSTVDRRNSNPRVDTGRASALRMTHETRAAAVHRARTPHGATARHTRRRLPQLLWSLRPRRREPGSTIPPRSPPEGNLPVYQSTSLPPEASQRASQFLLLQLCNSKFSRLIETHTH